MAHINIYLSNEDFFALRKLKDNLKCKTQEELLHEMIEIVKRQTQPASRNRSTTLSNGVKNSPSNGANSGVKKNG